MSHYLTMRDGVRIAADLHLPGSGCRDERFPALVMITRHCRALDLYAGLGWLEAPRLRLRCFPAARGDAVLNVDARGTGASFGSRRHEWDPEEVRDGGEIADWIAAQPSASAASTAPTPAQWRFLHPAVRTFVQDLW